MSQKISIITATLNRKDFLPRCIEGVATQSYSDKEHVIIDGGSTDGTIELLKSYEKEYPHIKWISEKDNGISSALNKGLAMATGEIIGVNGDDDFYLPNAFDLVAAEFSRDQEASLLSGGCDFIKNDGSVWMSQKASFTSRKDLIQCWRASGNVVTLPAPSTFIRKTAIDLVGGFDENDLYAMDYRHWIKITQKFPKVKTVDVVLARFRHDDGNVSFSLGDRQWREMLRISKEYWGPKWSPTYYQMLWSYFYHFKRPYLVQRVLRSRRLKSIAYAALGKKLD
ncbi:MAG: glycosyltransferase [Acidobacteriota bacterium]|nr:glycosyltransferase [Acidobacteriota bacterium]